MTTEYHFAVRDIVAIKFVKERPARFVWYPAEPAYTRLFGLIKYPAIEEGWVDEGSYQESRYTLEELKDYGYVMRNGTPHHKCHVEVFLEHDYQVSNTFETEEEARTWIDGIKSKAGKIFQLIEH